MPDVSVIIPTRNRCELLPRAIESARQAGSSVEIVVVDDASEDRTPDVCARFTDVRYVRSLHRLGVSGARNVGMLAVNSPYITFLDDDDLRLPGSIDLQLKILEARADAGMIYGQALYGDRDCQANGDLYPDRCPAGDTFWELLRWNFIPCPTVIFRRECLTRLGLLDEAAVGVEDWDWWIRIAEIYPVLATQQPVAIWRRPTLNSGQFTSHPENLHKRTKRLHRTKWMQLPRAAQADNEQRRKCVRDFAETATQQLIWESASRLKAEQPKDFARICFALMRMYPLGTLKKVFGVATWRSAVRAGRFFGQAVEHR